jgi:glycosyltransferase involved in cell wall biosynthesis
MRILLIAHGWPPASIGGTELYVRDLSRALARGTGDRVAVIAREADEGRPDLAVRHTSDAGVEVYRINNTFQSCRTFAESYRHPALEAALDPVLEAIDPEVVHIHHLTCLSTGLPGVLKARGAAVVLTLHDFWLMCHRGQRLDLHGRRCDAGVTGTCRRCIPAVAAAPGTARRAAGAVESLPGGRALMRTAVTLAGRVRAGSTSRALFDARRDEMRRALADVDLTLAPSATVEREFAAWGIPRARMRRHELGSAHPVAPRRGAPGRPLRIGFVGSFLPSKAPHLVVEAAASLPPGQVTVDLIGASAPYHGDASYGARLAPWLRHPCVRAVGAVQPEEMPERLAALDLLVLPSVWLENSPLVVREAFAAGLPVVASRLGGAAESVRDGFDGLLFTPGDVTALAAILARLVEEPGLYERLAAGVRAPRTIEDDARETRAIYASSRDRLSGRMAQGAS